MTVEAILVRKNPAVVTVDVVGTTVADASAVVADHGIGAVVVTDGAGSIAGIFSERDLAKVIAGSGAAALRLPISDVMTRNVVTCHREDHVDWVMQTMSAGRFRHLPVVDDEKLIGIISMRDVMEFQMEKLAMEARAMREYISYG